MYKSVFLIFAFVFSIASISAHAASSWNDAERQQAVKRLLTGNAQAFGCQGKCKHNVFEVRSLDFGDHTRKMIMASTSYAGNDCHACAPHLSYFFYHVDAEGWKLTSKHVAHHQFGSWGDYPQDLMSFDKLSDDEALVILRFGYTGQGYTEESITGLLEKEDKLLEVVNTCSGSSNGGAITDDKDLESWTAEVNIAASVSASGLSSLVFDITDEAKSNAKSIATFTYDGSKFAYASGDARMKDCGY